MTTLLHERAHLPARGCTLACAAMTALLLIGCNAGAREAKKKETSHVRAITALYARASSTLGHNPKNEQEFKSAVSGADVNLKAFGVENIDELFVSERDGKPLVILYGPAPKGVAPGVIVYEQEGAGGVRQVGFKIGQVEEADATRFAELVPKPAGG
jgi:hypothetical protein